MGTEAIWDDSRKVFDQSAPCNMGNSMDATGSDCGEAGFHVDFCRREQRFAEALPGIEGRGGIKCNTRTLDYTADQ